MSDTVMTHDEKLREAYELGDQAELYGRKYERLQREAELALETFHYLSEQSRKLIREVLED